MAVESYIDSRRTGIAMFTAPVSVASLAIILRIISRYRSKIKYGWDDVFAIAALVFFWALSAVGLWNVFSINPFDTTPANRLNTAMVSLKALYINTLFTICVLSCAKISILCLYNRIFGVHESYRKIINILIAISSAWWVGVFFMAIFRCLPIPAAWDPRLTPTAQCYSLQTAFLATEIINCLTEVLMAVMLAVMVRRLRLPMRLRIGVGLVFAVGIFVVITSVVRIAMLYAPAEGNEGLLRSGLWGNIQMCTAICCACLPTYRGLLPKDWNILMSLQSWMSDLSSGRNRSRTNDLESNSVEPKSDSIDAHSASSLHMQMKADAAPLRISTAPLQVPEKQRRSLYAISPIDHDQEDMDNALRLGTPRTGADAV